MSCKMNYIEFLNASDMYDKITHNDLYSDEDELYVFNYNDDGAICVYHITNKEAKELEQKSLELNEYWGAFLGIGGDIYDNPMDFCNEHYEGRWRCVS